jgi:hypothetical protein
MSKHFTNWLKPIFTMINFVNRTRHVVGMFMLLIYPTRVHESVCTVPHEPSAPTSQTLGALVVETMYHTTYKAARYMFVAILLTPRRTLLLAIHKNWFVIFEFRKREMFDSIKFVLNVIKIYEIDHK